MALSCDFEILKIFGFGDGTSDMDGEAGDVLYAAYLSMARAGIASLEMFDVKSMKWGQVCKTGCLFCPIPDYLRSKG